MGSLSNGGWVGSSSHALLGVVATNNHEGVVKSNNSPQRALPWAVGGNCAPHNGYVVRFLPPPCSPPGASGAKAGHGALSVAIWAKAADAP